MLTRSHDPTNAQPAHAATPTRTLPVLGPFFDSRPIRPVMVALRRPGPLAGMRVRKKLIVLHTLFTLLMATVLLVALRPAVGAIVREAELDKAMHVLRTPGVVASLRREGPDALAHESDALVIVQTAGMLGLEPEIQVAAVARSGEPLRTKTRRLGEAAIVHIGRGEDGTERFAALSMRIPQVRRQVARVYIFTSAALLAMYVLVVTALEVLVLPQNVYRPIRRVLDADDALRRGDRRAELIPPGDIPSDELGEIMQSRNESITRLRKQERDLEKALSRLEEVAGDLRKKNHLLEAARRNLADADRLAALGMMSAGIAHELNTPLAVVKGLVEKLRDSNGSLSEADTRLLLRVVGRLERLSEGLLDYARVRPPRCEPASVRAMIDEAVALVRLDRQAADVMFVVDASPEVCVSCDADRIAQVLVNLLRNAVDAMRLRRGEPEQPPLIHVTARVTQRDADHWLTITVADNGPGIDPSILPNLFEPFASTRLDSTGTGLGLAVADGIVREHGGVLVARNKVESHGAVFEVVLPMHALAPDTPQEVNA